MTAMLQWQNPTLTGSALQGQPVTSGTGTWTHHPSAFLFQWQNSPDGVSWTNIAGATSSSYPPGPADVDLYVRVQVTAVNANGPSLPSMSAAIGPIFGRPKINVADVSSSADSATMRVSVGVSGRDSATAIDAPALLLPTLLLSVGDAVAVADSAVVSSGTTGLAASIQLVTSAGTNTSILAFPASTAPPTSPATSLYLQFPALPPKPATLTPMIRLIIHNDSNGGAPNSGTPIQPVLLNSDNSLFNGNGGNIPLVEPGNRTLGGGTSWGTINVSVPGIPTANMKIALQNLVTGDPAGFSVSVLAWTA